MIKMVSPPRLLVAVLLLLVMAGCSLASPSAPGPTAQIAPTQTAVVLRETVLVVVSATSPPPSATPEKSATPPPAQPSATPRPSPTSLALRNIPIEGGDPNNKFFASLVFPDYRPAATKSLVFRVFAHKPFDSKLDGEGIAAVDFRILNSNGEAVYSRQEKQAGYCAFGGGEPDCTVYDFAANKFQWPDGRKIQSGAYTLDILVTAKDQTVLFGEAEFSINVP